MRRSDGNSRAGANGGAVTLEVTPEAATDEPLDGRSRFAVNAIMWAIVVSVLTMKISIFQIEIPMLCAYGLIVFLALHGYVKINAVRASLYFIAVGAVLISTSANASNMSALSVLSLIVFYGVFIFSIDLEQPAYFHLLRKFQTFGLFVAGLVFFNWACNLIGQPWPNLNKIIPAELQYGNYVYLQPIHYGSRYMKPNAIFFLETSHTVQFVALATIIEICLFRRLKFMAPMGLATILTFSGTGLLLIVLCAPFMVRYIPRRYLIPGLLALPLVFGVAASVGLVDNAIKRSAEFSQSRGSSGQGRFIEPYKLIGEALAGPYKELFFGIGPGQGKKQAPTSHEAPVLLPPATKVMVEYGVFVLVAFMAFTSISVFVGGVPFVIGWAVLMQYMFLNGSFLVPLHIVYCYFLAGAYTFSRQVPAALGPMEDGDRMRAAAGPAE